jgi:hypothetical protein
MKRVNRFHQSMSYLFLWSFNARNWKNFVEYSYEAQSLLKILTFFHVESNTGEEQLNLTHIAQNSLNKIFQEN